MKTKIITTSAGRLACGITSTLLTVTLLAGANYAAGQSIYSTLFENPPFVEGLPLAGQDGWVAPSIFNPLAAIISSDKPRQGAQSVQVLGADLEHSDLVNELTDGYYDTIGSYRRPVNFETGGNLRVRVSAHVRIDGPATPGVNFFSAALAVRAAVVDTDGNIIDSAGAGQIDISSDGYAHGNDGNHNVPVFLNSVPIARGQWHLLAIDEDFQAQTFTLSVDGVGLGAFPFPEDVNSTILLRASLLVFAAPDAGSMTKAAYSAHYDRFDIRVTGQTNPL